MKAVALTGGIPLISALAVLTGVPVSAAAVEPKTKSETFEVSNGALLDGKDLELLMSVSENGRLLAWLAEFARTKAEAERLRSLGAILVRDQVGENEKFQKIARDRGVKIEADEKPVQQKKIESELAKDAGYQRDKVLVARILVVGAALVSVYERGVESEDPVIRDFCERMLPRTKEKLRQVRGVQQGRLNPESSLRDAENSPEKA